MTMTGDPDGHSAVGSSINSPVYFVLLNRKNLFTTLMAQAAPCGFSDISGQQTKRF